MSPPVGPRGRSADSLPIRVIVINCSAWPRFVPAVRTEALDLYAEEARVEFWDVTMVETEETVVWGQWPKPFSQHPRRFVDEIRDRVGHLDEEASERLTVLMVFDSPDIRSAESGSERDAGANPRGQALKVAVAAVDRLSRAIADDDPSMRARVLWVAAFQGAQADARNRAAAFDLVAPSSPGFTGSRLFETAVFLAGPRGIGQSPRSAFTALRILIDLARDDEAARALLRAVPNSREGRVLVLRSAPILHNPSDQTRARLAGLIGKALDPDASTVDDPAEDQVGPIVTKLLQRLSASLVGRIVAFSAADAPGPPGAGDTSVLDEGTAALSVERWRETRSVPEVADAYVEAKRDLETLYDQRDRNLAHERVSLDDNARDNNHLLDELRGAAVDTTFGVSGKVKRHIEDAHARLAGKFRALTLDANAFRDAHTSARVGVKAIPANKLDCPRDGLQAAVSAWLPYRVVIAAGLASVAVVVIFYGLVFVTAEVTIWTFMPLAAAVAAWLAGWLWIGVQWRRIERRRIDAAVAVQDAQERAVADIKEIATTGLRHVATARLAGRCLPFLILMARRAEEIGRVREQMRRVYGSLEGGRARLDADDGFAARATDRLRKLPQADAFKTILWQEKPPETVLQELEFDVGRSSLSFRSTLAFQGAVQAEVVPPPPFEAPRPDDLPVDRRA